VQGRSGIADDLPQVDAIYVNAAITQPSRAWLDALRPSGRLMFPLHAPRGFGGMLRVERPASGMVWAARFVSRAGFIACHGPQDEAAGQRLTTVFARKDLQAVQSMRLDATPDATCWYAGDDWWLSTAPPAG
jgi:protein-L-isoaspartate(D-aspartate) O-methyltransferase